MEKVINEIFKEIHETYESYDGGLIHLDNTSEDQIKESIKKAINYTRCCLELGEDHDFRYICENQNCLEKKCKKCGKLA